MTPGTGLFSSYAVTFAYDALGRRVSKHFRGRATRWFWDGAVPLHEWHELEVGPGAGNVADLTTWLFEETSFAPMAKLTATGAYSVVSDHLGTPLTLYDGQGKATWEMTLDSYGAVRQGQGKAQDCPFRYQGQYEDVETGLYYNRFRYYDPETGGYISQDPIGLGGGCMLYGYVNNPTKLIDPLGLSEVFGLICGLSGDFIDKASKLDVIKPGTKQWRQAVENIKTVRGKGKSNFRVANQEHAERLLSEAKPNMPKFDTFTETPYKKGYELHPNESHTKNAPHQDLEHVKWKNWENGKSGADGHIFW